MSNTSYTFRCDKCNYSTTRRFNYMKHINTEKHTLLTSETPENFILPSFSMTNQVYYKCQKCDRKYTLKRNLWRHFKQCNEDGCSIISYVNASDPTEHSASEIESKMPTTHDYSKMCSEMLEVIRSNQTFQNQLLEIIKNQKPSVNNTVIQGDVIHNQTLNLNVFLNEKCKDAMNITEFANSIELSTEDMENVGRNGYVKGMSSIFIDNLKNTDIHKRPIHCTDRKREVLYVKDHDRWEREDITSQKMINAVRTVEKKNIGLLNEWAKQNPECEKSCTRANDVYMKLSRGVLDGDDDNITKVVRNIVKETVIERNNLVE
jgi:hypothetical protein